MDYAVEYRKNSMPMELFQQKYQDREKYLAYCRECPKYNNVWSCPPLQIDADAYLSKYAWVNVVGAKIILDHKVIEKADTPEKIKTVGWTIVSEVKLMLEEEMRKLESQLPGSVSLSSGGCSLCGECTRKTGKTCRQVDKMRYSMDAFGFDLSAITKDMLGIEIMWCKDRLPDYFTLIHGILTREVAFPPAIRHLK
ncbi:Predicted metal-binding protein [Selenomonas ruminantium]|uniref:Predicted metal-binding protein n=2 Tax=Selenomonas ruminantium TaxID=971 RepID=A0A1H0VES6_SELRU|nr:Predicted metal-binding protein [Selenomonas ruminantium]